ncbi:uncharacterized protein LOC131318470 isoform X3 [Rhododendron vialii]|uniref:uncharacterized protein LOC131318470 isoform X3 n=1 Tax=Rhododendron vialii TaxID=182163 RepID=UPI0026601EB4|nr:uncharacterized protein LOC131318470 isoform X3 [Rhododendron vialii]
MLQVVGVNCGPNLIEQLKNLKNGVSARVIIFSVILLTGAFISIHWSDVSITGASFLNTFMPTTRSGTSQVKINCNITTCPAHDQVTNKTFGSSAEECPEYFKWIHEDLRPWKDTGITLEMVESADKLAYIRIVVVKGRVYLKKFKWVFQTRDVFNIWGILQLLRLYPGELPDLDIMFECGDMPVIKKSAYKGSEAAKIPPMFHYCGSDSTFDITFPDWSFWGWPELQIKPWENLEKELQEGNYKVKWKDRVPYAYWKGNIWTGRVRQDLLKCNVSKKQDSGALIYHVDWRHEEQKKFKNTNLASQCNHRYGKLLKYQPTIPEGAAEMCLESMACGGRGLEKTYMFDSMVKGPSDSSPCIMPEPFDSTTLQAFIERKANLTKQVEEWEVGETK